MKDLGPLTTTFTSTGSDCQSTYLAMYSWLALILWWVFMKTKVASKIPFAAFTPSYSRLESHGGDTGLHLWTSPCKIALNSKRFM